MIASKCKARWGKRARDSVSARLRDRSQSNNNALFRFERRKFDSTVFVDLATGRTAAVEVFFDVVPAKATYLAFIELFMRGLADVFPLERNTPGNRRDRV